MQTRALVVLSLSTAAALQLSRRDLAQAIGIGAATTLAPAANAADIKSCPKGANNCFSTASTDKTALKPWTFPGKTADAVEKQLLAPLAQLLMSAAFAAAFEAPEGAVLSSACPALEYHTERLAGTA